MPDNSVLAQIQDLEDRVLERFCSIQRRLVRKLDWVEETASFEEIESAILETIRFYEARGFYLFQEPWLEHEPFQKRLRPVLTFRPTETNQ